MQALTFHGEQDIRYSRVVDPQITVDHQILLKISLSALCGSDLHVYHGRENPDQGTIMGHEAVGEIVACGKAVSRFKVGDRVFSPFFTCCGSCFYCQEDLSCRCQQGSLYGWIENGSGLQGLQAEYAIVPYADTTLYHIPDWMDQEQALLLCDIFPTGYFCADMAFDGPQRTYVVIGCGPVGLMAIQALKLMGAERILAIDLNRSRLDYAEAAGAQGFIGQTEAIYGEILERTEGRGADAVLEVVGNSAAQALAMQLVRPGGKIAVAGVHHAANFAFSPGVLYDKNITYQTGRCPVQRYVPALIEAIRKHDPGIKSVITHRLPLAEGVDGYRRFAQREPGMLKTIFSV